MKKAQDTKEKMTLEQLLAKIPDWQVIAIGAHSSWFVIAEKQVAVRQLDRLDKSFAAQMPKVYNRTCNRLKMHMYPMNPGSYDDPMAYRKALLRKAQEIKDAVMEIGVLEATGAPDGYVPLAKRKVLKHYKNVSDRDDVYSPIPFYAIVLEGLEDGQYWTREEYEKDAEANGWK